MSSTPTLSTGQTLQDLIFLSQLRNLSGNADKVPPGWMPPALADPNYVPPVRLKGANFIMENHHNSKDPGVQIIIPGGLVAATGVGE
ncbi:hypothetical protein ABW19_dt0206130 [Dactylella cylindrospora]|nr:hypothetical protein ABW19_dt0206130 [Dactylella cylindrospora]